MPPVPPKAVPAAPSLTPDEGEEAIRARKWIRTGFFGDMYADPRRVWGYLSHNALHILRDYASKVLDIRLHCLSRKKPPGNYPYVKKVDPLVEQKQPMLQVLMSGSKSSVVCVV